VTAVAHTPANTLDGPTGVELSAGKAPGRQVLADAASGSEPTPAVLHEAQHRKVIKPIPLRRAVPGGFDRDDSTVDHDTGTVTCPPATPSRSQPRLPRTATSVAGTCSRSVPKSEELESVFVEEGTRTC
jgi:hypothetical protein